MQSQFSGPKSPVLHNYFHSYKTCTHFNLKAVIALIFLCQCHSTQFLSLSRNQWLWARLMVSKVWQHLDECNPILSGLVQVINRIRWLQRESPICYLQVWLQSELDNMKPCYQSMKPWKHLRNKLVTGYTFWLKNNC